MKDEDDILTRDMVKLLTRYRKLEREKLAIMIMYHIRTHLKRYFQIINKEE